MYSNLGSPWQPLAMGVPQEPAPAQGILMDDLVHPIAIAPIQGIEIAPVCPIPVAPPMMGFPPIEPLRGIETRPVESLEFYSSPNTQRQSWRNRPPSRGSYQPAQEGKGGSTSGGTEHQKEARRDKGKGGGQEGASSGGRDKGGQGGKGKLVCEAKRGEWRDVPGFKGFVKVRTKRSDSTRGAPYPAQDSGGTSRWPTGASRGGRGSGGFGGGAHGDYEQTGWDHRHWLEQYSAGIATGQDGFVKQLRQQVADHNFGMFQRDVGNLGRVPETIYASYSDTFRKRVAGTGRDPKISFSGATTTEAIMYFAQQHGREVCALNFANGEHVGGGYVRGAKAQEEDICRTFPLLYTSLIRAKKKRLYPYGPPAGPHRYSDVLFTGRVLCCRGEESEGYRMLHERERFTASFVSGAAPNIRKGEQFDREKFVNAIKNIVVAPRIHAPELNVLLLGAWGCGAFGGDPEVVAQCYIEVLKMPIARLWHEIHFPIPGSGLNENARVFSKTLARAFPGMDTYSNLGSL
eukprot:GEMP01007579.1.p1 GENE.GEMP01007579.1~~GEMP01007579.1.p1  ORF type:complete len:518 (+),score=79.66 GEMP01007579.1:186-1739(+)